MRILFVTPYPPSSYRVRSYGFLKQLQRHHEVTVLALCHSEREMKDAQALRCQNYEVVAVQEPHWQGMLRSAWAVINQDSLHAAYARSVPFTSALSDIYERRQFDIVHVEHLRGIIATRFLTHPFPLVWDAVDCISLLYKHTAVSGADWPHRLLAQLEYHRIQQYEASFLKAIQHVIVTSETDRQAMLNLLNVTASNPAEAMSRPYPIITVLPNGVNMRHPAPIALKRRFNIVFSGKMNYHPNSATAFYLYKHIMPLIWQQQPQATLTIAGGDPPEALQRIANDPRVEVTGFVDDLRPYIERAEVMLCPILYGTGIQNKVLEAMALGTPVVASPQAIQALAVCPGRELLVAESPEEFAKTILHLLEDVDLQTTLSKQGRLYVEQHHDWQIITDELVDLYQQAIVNQQCKVSSCF